jgi:hypothetical protein
MAEVIFRLPGNEQYSYVEVKFDEEELDGPGGEEAAQELLNTTLAQLNATFQAVGGQNQGASQSGYGQQSNSNIPSCQHGQRVEKSGSSSRGQWKAYMCPSKDRSNQCKPIDAVTGKAWA